MLTKASDIHLVLSGGSTNLNPNGSLGGEPSSNPVQDGLLNNLFNDVSSDESNDGNEDYRCVYLFNDGDTAIYNFELWISEDPDSGATMELGIEDRDESQRISIAGIPTGGSFTISYETEIGVIDWDNDLGVVSASLQAVLDNIIIDDVPAFRNITVTAQNVGSSSVIFDIRFAGKDGKRNWSKIDIADNNLIPTLTISVITPQQGAPVNTVAAEINLDTTPPGGVTFFVPSSQSPITIPRLEPSEGFPMWIKRVVPAGTPAEDGDNFSIRFRAHSLEPA